MSKILNTLLSDKILFVEIISLVVGTATFLAGIFGRDAFNLFCGGTIVVCNYLSIQKRIDSLPNYPKA